MENKENKKIKTLRGVVVSDKMQDTVVVSVSSFTKHPKYKKYIRREKKFKVDDKGNKHKVGDSVTIVETKPISKTKTFVINK